MKFEKSFVQSECLYPKVALVDPELTISVPKNHTAYGVCDIITHVTEAYLNGVDGTPIQDRFAEGVIHDENGCLPARPPMTEADIIEVLRSAL